MTQAASWQKPKDARVVLMPSGEGESSPLLSWEGPLFPPQDHPGRRDGSPPTAQTPAWMVRAGHPPPGSSLTHLRSSFCCRRLLPSSSKTLQGEREGHWGRPDERARTTPEPSPSTSVFFKPLPSRLLGMGQGQKVKLYSGNWLET